MYPFWYDPLFFVHDFRAKTVWVVKPACVDVYDEHGRTTWQQQGGAIWSEVRERRRTTDGIGEGGHGREERL